MWWGWDGAGMESWCSQMLVGDCLTSRFLLPCCSLHGLGQARCCSGPGDPSQAGACTPRCPTFPHRGWVPSALWEAPPVSRDAFASRAAPVLSLIQRGQREILPGGVWGLPKPHSLGQMGTTRGLMGTAWRSMGTVWGSVGPGGGPGGGQGAMLAAC